ncbi:EAL domain-containing protein [Pseudodesulfovibrio piezophilus]|uniref:Diguanylate cyclase/phosphodiesterase with PAS/PAC sensor(S) n=1 Tax=Pseudodesulfovibrio piezophilus (strain DSM 21447 / JCM 15486 / C1TLV30) TaxID=1322246 RepID=M1WRM5_PSEP2|nr:EAL domain-containing protein [Pseudodesulfovibrio piezophilus]CCH49654.1 Diguanylate cyclase/phosphodiesterase with PAS/PAC sensor(S) [Pseudodesulfovibrio piezophilus C1TLV30]
MTANRIARLITFTPFRIVLPTVIMTLLFAGSVFIYLLPSIQHTLLSYKKETIFELTSSVISTLAHLDARVIKGELSKEEAQDMGKEIIRSLRYGPQAKDYFWINDISGFMIMHPYRPDLEGKNVAAVKDREGKALFLEFIRLVSDHGYGFIDYFWQWKDRPERIGKKLSFVREFKPWGWVVGTGFYIDEVNSQIREYRNMVASIFLVILILMAGMQAYILRESALTEKKKVRAMSQRERLISALQLGEERYRTIADFAYDWELWIGMSGEVLYCSPSCERITGYPPERFFESPELIEEIIVKDDLDIWQAYLIEANKEEGSSLDFRIITPLGEIRWLNAVGRSVSGIGMKPLGIRVSLRNITDRKEMEVKLRHQALHDPLTGLSNRTLCLDRISQAIRRTRRRDEAYFAVVFLDLDRFKVINDSLGHRFGDLVLIETAKRLSEHIRTLDTVSRFGGDEFVLLLDELSSPGEAIRIIKRIRRAIAQPFMLNETQVQTTASLGIVLSPTGDAKASDVLQRANIAMHRAKEAGRNRFKVFTNRMLESAVELLTLENDMRRGLESGEFFVVFQPIMDLRGEDLMGFEALARWNHPIRGAISPSEFIPMAEESGMILPLGEWVLRTSIKTLADWRKASIGATGLFISVNISSKQFARLELDKIVMKALHDANLPPEALKLEITESTILENPEAAVRILERLRKQGVHFSIDDFGTGYSSLSQLQQLPVDTLKVDRSFISRMKSDPENMEIVKAVIALAHSLDLDVIAEGVEEEEQLCSLIDLNCQSVQGFYFHKPLSKEKAEELIWQRANFDDSSPRQTMAQAVRRCSGTGKKG